MNKSLALGIVIALTGLLLGCVSKSISPTPTAENSAPVSPTSEVIGPISVPKLEKLAAEDGQWE